MAAGGCSGPGVPSYHRIFQGPPIRGLSLVVCFEPSPLPSFLRRHICHLRKVFVACFKPLLRYPRRAEHARQSQRDLPRFVVRIRAMKTPESRDSGNSLRDLSLSLSLYSYTCTYIHICTICLSTSMYACMHVCMYVCMYVCINACILCTCFGCCLCLCLGLYLSFSLHIYVLYIYIYTYIFNPNVASPMYL